MFGKNLKKNTSLNKKISNRNLLVLTDFLNINVIFIARYFIYSAFLN